MSSSFVVNKSTAWILYNDAKCWGTTPSELLQIDDWYTGYCLNQAIGCWGTWVSNELDEAPGDDDKPEMAKMKRRQRLHEILTGSDKPLTGMYADPAALFG